MSTDKLTIRQEQFCNYYLETANASEAYRRAFTCKNMKDKTIWEKASSLLATGKVKARVMELQGELKEKSDQSKDRILSELECILDAKITDYVELKSGLLKFKDFADLSERQVKAIESVKQGRNGIELRLHGKSWTIERICKMLGYDTPLKVETKSMDNLENLTDDQLRQIINE